MATGTTNHKPDKNDPDHRAAVVKAALLAAGSFIAALGTLLAIAGEWGTSDETIRYAISVAFLVTALAFSIAAIYVWPPRS